MKFVNIFMLLVALAAAAQAQEDFLGEDAPPPPNVNGLFEDELEPLDEAQVQRAQPPRAESEQTGQGTLRFPEPKKVTSSRSSSKLPANVVPKSNEKLRMDFVQVDIEEVVKYFSERLQKKFIYDPTMLAGKITIISPVDVTLREAWAAFLSAMEVRGYVVYPAGAYLKIEKAANARKAPVPIYEGSTPNDDSYVTRILTLKYLTVNDIKTAVRSLLSRTGGDLIEFPQTNTLIISDYAYNIRRIVRILDVLDVEGFQEQLEIIALKNASAQDIARKIAEFFPSTTQGPTRVTGSTAARLRRASSSGSEGVIQKVVADERTNSIIILGSERGIEQVRKFIKRIDVATEGGGGQIHVYPIQNVKADEIAATLTALTSAAAKDHRPTVPTVGTRLPIVSPTTEVANLGEVKVTADKATNSLVIISSPRDFEVLKTIIRKLDIRRRQVFLEGAILEASVSKDSAFGLSGVGPLGRVDALKNGSTSKSSFVGSLNGLGLDTIFQNPGSLTGMALGFRSSGNYTVSYTNSDGTTQEYQLPLLSAILRLSAGNRDLNVLSTPHILATANEEATLSIGQEIPQEAGKEVTAGGNTSYNITRLNVATELTITPQINAGDYLTLKIKQKINDVGAVSETTGQVTTNKREASTTVIIKDQQTVVIGGLMRDRKTVSNSKVPFLGDIPVLGWLFKTRITGSEKVNLLIFLTPYIIRDTADANDHFFRKLRERQEFLKSIGTEEKKGIPTSGLNEDQIKMLDPEYVKSLNLMNVQKSASAHGPDRASDETTPLLVPDSPKQEAPQPLAPADSQESTPSDTLQPIVPPVENPAGAEPEDSSNEKIYVPSGGNSDSAPLIDTAPQIEHHGLEFAPPPESPEGDSNAPDSNGGIILEDTPPNTGD